MKTVTLRNPPPELLRMIRKKASEKKVSLNKAVIGLLEEGAGLSKKPKRILSHDLDDLAGSWSEEEARAFEKNLQRQRVIDEDLWK